MKKFEYKVIRTNPMNLEDELNDESTEGWKFVQMELIGKVDLCVVLEREVI